jgi:hypothetical protein
LGIKSYWFKYSKKFFSRSRNKSAALAFGGYNGTAYIAATEEWTGPGALTTKTITVS